jgi:hypothetical protein
MLMTIPDEGKLLLLYWALGTDGSDLEDFTVDLYQNNIAVTDTSTLTDFTIANFIGYVNVPVDRADFDAPVLAGHVGTINVPSPPSFTCTGGVSQTCFGWIMSGQTSGKVICGAKFDVARIFTPGTTETLDPFTISDKTFA